MVVMVVLAVRLVVRAAAAADLVLRRVQAATQLAPTVEV